MTAEQPGTGAVQGVDPDYYRRVIGRLVTGVTVLTTYAGGLDHAMTASAVMSVSLDPVLVVASVEQEARFHDAIIEAGVWGISILPASARSTAAWLATRGRPLHDQLDRVPHTRGGATGVALVDDALAQLECRTVDAHAAGDHTLVVGAVVAMRDAERPQDALTYYRGRFGAHP
ncbi:MULTISPECIES: flavin reductase family protein [Allobranchiibius]|uniref:Flavin reductase (DIM6/NTAB) family NADH-FMN oxidoreductase RutF n=1 Tax=Allobranchiibius huperziae TaxID=1874116 RepID=A0A853DFV1_9MICO|nr:MULTISPECIES: flavin reductase family protein [Allobranchiibius]MBO1767944.1 flavin reductase [Allobranchiibius sp. GilTou38]NYJ75567.1 flavin reductase (DIM6/NTAB) family NADH-FMN oxidoreductase RutF [Allobranchiibius huperziae]